MSWPPRYKRPPMHPDDAAALRRLLFICAAMIAFAATVYAFDARWWPGTVAGEVLAGAIIIWARRDRRRP